MSGFIQWLEDLSAKDRKVRAVLRRSLSFDPGNYVHAYPYIEPFVKDEGHSWRRTMHYLAAGLWATHWREGMTGQPMTLGQACAAHQSTSKSVSTERRFITLLDSDGEQLPNRLRQMIALLKEQVIDFESILRGLVNWNDDQKRTQNAWARDFYRNLDQESKKALVNRKEENQ